uniref:Endonuclease/exonuclease/phosphatase domain-containing protein n=1 Tax=Octopus bimaculoides TaxID=37653 RepID=A0A0L8IAK6_OCTBM
MRIGGTNDRRLQLLESGSTHKLAPANTLFSHKTSCRTWHAYNDRTHNQFDFILVSQQLKSSINMARSRTFLGTDVNSDHDVVIMTTRLKLKRTYKKRAIHIRFDVDKLKDPKVAVEFEAKVGGRFAALNFLKDDINSLTDNIKETLCELAVDVLGRRKNKPWVADDILDLGDIRWDPRETKLKG